MSVWDLVVRDSEFSGVEVRVYAALFSGLNAAIWAGNDYVEMSIIAVDDQGADPMLVPLLQEEGRETQ